GLLVPVSSLSGGGRILGLGFPSAWYQPISVGTFTKGLGFDDLWLNVMMLAGFFVLYLVAAKLILRKQGTGHDHGNLRPTGDTKTGGEIGAAHTSFQYLSSSVERAEKHSRRSNDADSCRLHLQRCGLHGCNRRFDRSERSDGRRG